MKTVKHKVAKVASSPNEKDDLLCLFTFVIIELHLNDFQFNLTLIYVIQVYCLPETSSSMFKPPSLQVNYFLLAAQSESLKSRQVELLCLN